MPEDNQAKPVTQLSVAEINAVTSLEAIATCAYTLMASGKLSVGGIDSKEASEWSDFRFHEDDMLEANKILNILAHARSRGIPIGLAVIAKMRFNKRDGKIGENN